MYNEKLEALIDAALADGELTEKEKQILFKKAQEMGVDLDEFEMVLDARLVKLKKAEEEKAKSSAPKSNKLGDVKKCPACGAIVQSYQGVCAECGYTFRNFEESPFIKKLSDSYNRTNSYEKGEFIESIPIPTPKGDLFEMITWLQSIDSDYTYDKLEACFVKARSLYPNDILFNEVINKQKDIQKSVQKSKKVKATKKTVTVILWLLAIALCAMEWVWLYDSWWIIFIILLNLFTFNLPLLGSGIVDDFF